MRERSRPSRILWDEGRGVRLVGGLAELCLQRGQGTCRSLPGATYLYLHKDAMRGQEEDSRVLSHQNWGRLWVIVLPIDSPRGLIHGEDE